MNNNLKNIIKEIGMKASSVQMYENTLEEMKKAGAPTTSISQIVREKSETELDMAKLLEKAQTHLRQTKSNENIETKKWAFERLVDAWEKEGNDDMPDTVLSKEADKYRAKQLSFDFKEELDENDEEYTYYKSETEDYKNKNLTTQNNSLTNINNAMSNAVWLKNNGFVVKFPEELKIPTWRVKSVDKLNLMAPTRNDGAIPLVDNIKCAVTYQAIFKLADYVDDNGCVLIKELNHLMRMKKYIGSIDIDIVSNNELKRYYTMRLHNCTINWIMVSSSSYDDDSIRTLEMSIIYENYTII